jgi:hypothetical protein
MKAPTKAPARRAYLLGALLVPLLVPAPAAADTIPLSALPDRPARYAQAAGRVHVEVTAGTEDHDVRGAGSICLISDLPAYWIDGDGALDGRYADLRLGAGVPFGIERLVVRRDGGAELERIAAVIEDERGVAVPRARSRIPLHEVARLEGLVVYAYRWAGKVFLLARSLEGALLRRDGGHGFEESLCGVAVTQMRVRNGASEPVQLEGRIPATGKRYLVDASVSQTGRDPAPLLAVTARLVER